MIKAISLPVSGCLLLTFQRLDSEILSCWPFGAPLKFSVASSLDFRWKINNYRSILPYRVFSHDVTAAMLVSQNKEMAAMLVSQPKPLGIELYFYANTFFCFIKPI